MANDRANDPRRVYTSPGGTMEDENAQRKFSAHGFNKGKASDMAKNVVDNAVTAFKSTSGFARSNRRQHKSNLLQRGATTAAQKNQGVV